MSVRNVHSQAQSRLGTLPAEITNQIYTLALTVSTKRPIGMLKKLNAKAGDSGLTSRIFDDLVLRCTTGLYDEGEDSVLINKPQRRPDRPSVLSLLLTCRLIHDEAYGLFYSTQTLRIQCMTKGADSNATLPLTCLARALRKPRLDAFRSLSIQMDSVECLSLIFKVLRKFSQLETLRIHIMRKVELERFERERHFIRSNCAMLPHSLQHFHWSTGEPPRPRSPFYWQQHWDPLTEDEEDDMRELVLGCLERVQHPDVSIPDQSAEEDCSCLWCDPDLKVKSLEAGGARKRKRTSATEAASE